MVFAPRAGGGDVLVALASSATTSGAWFLRCLVGSFFGTMLTGKRFFGSYFWNFFSSCGYAHDVSL